MEVTRIAVDRLEMGIVLLLHPQRVRQMYTVADKVEHEFVFRMGMADGEMELAGTYTFIIYNRVAAEYDGLRAVFAGGHHGQGVLQAYRVAGTVGKLVTGTHQTIDGTFDGSAGCQEVRGKR
jgi:hypothetical protein